MGLSIKTKHPCNTIGFSTNKGKKPEQIQLSSEKIALKYPDLGIVVLRPSIDRITFGFLPDEKLLKKYDPSASLEEYKEFIRTSLAGDGFYTAVTGLSYVQGVSFKKPPYSNYNVNLTFKPCDESENVIIQIDPKKGGYSFIRIDMNPNRITVAGMKSFWSLLDDILLLPSGPISREDFRIWSKIYTLEVAIDILGVRPNDTEYISMTNYKPVPQKSHVYKSKTGRTETKYAKIKKDKAHAEYLYDKRQERVDQGMEPIYGDFLHSRFEFRVHKTLFYKLAKITNRCVRVALRSLDYAAFDKLPYTDHMFIRYALERNVAKALEMIPHELQQQYEQTYNSTMRGIWDPKKIWSYWPEVLKQSGLFLD